MPTILDGKKLSQTILDELSAEVYALKSQGIQPGLAVILVGDDPASKVYVGSKQKTCEKIGILSKSSILPAATSQAELLSVVQQYNDDPQIHGILCQLPLPHHLDENEVINAIAPQKDVDCFHPDNVGRVLIGAPRFLPCTPHGVVQLIKRTGIETTGKHAVIVGRSDIVGKPLAAMMLQKDSGSNMGCNSTVTICHSATRNLEEVCAQADILVAAIGKPEFIKAHMVKEGAVVIDVGINRIDADNSKGYRLVGDVAYDEVAPKSSAITPVPGGVGPMTIAMLMYNTVKSAKLAHA
ncbi:bifunctional methylenetetrahydrofolate dehydrogenase/methenyltetrahydrofolate cyclohydrolase FolD [Desulfurispirillum indicum]|uniref:bifunctional methylenetetrahydrofolate dehydrogenase/methenyltetrahydrofolate cyclohydrolase FolD n=1 Tax=Desulfurispirillum indicum TaxID=936456 RepID=UPI001CF94BE9|nr:bifunctional methylenetetrahydrofolate dehydrogenase/methenyltetrahydrofolate cyclohydrolase FolD [Desulfurispirillum indicum]UCZ57746.1 bifunctional methylenetetrahydrofolate dehydrogenase/methenyltetrahydrofolate cyclohydrolase FolD [Desulfurispirillum indicum]